MQAVILAAGLGRRLGDHAEGKPKCLVDIDGSTLLERSLTNLGRGGIREAVIILGFRGDLIRDLVGTEFAGVKIAYAENPRYDSTGNMFSLSRARHLLKSDTMILEADLIYHGDVIARLLHAPEKNVIVVGHLLHHGDDVLIRTDARNRIVDLGKEICGEEAAAGALLGISKYSPEFMQALFEQAERDFSAGHKNFHYEETVLTTCRSGRPVHALACLDIDWTEIDNESDLIRARDEVYPRIRATQDSGDH